MPEGQMPTPTDGIVPASETEEDTVSRLRIIIPGYSRRGLPRAPGGIPCFVLVPLAAALSRAHTKHGLPMAHVRDPVFRLSGLFAP